LVFSHSYAALQPEIVNHVLGIDVGQAGPAAPVAAHANLLVRVLRKTPVMVVIPVLQPVLFQWPEIVSACHLCKVNDIAGIQYALLMGSLEINVDVFLYAVAVAGGAYHGAGTAVEALVSPFFPDGGFEFYIQKAGQTRDLNLGLEAGFNKLSSFNEFLIVFFSGLACFNMLEEIKGLGGINGQIIPVTDIRTEKVESPCGRMLVERLAETVFQRFVVHADKKGVPAPGNIVGRGKIAFNKNFVQYVEGKGRTPMITRGLTRYSICWSQSSFLKWYWESSSRKGRKKFLMEELERV
jgi:hypothetical protein